MGRIADLQIPVFGVELDFLLQRETEGEVPPGTVPCILDQCLSEIEARGLQEVGLYRIPGASSAISAIREQFDSGMMPFGQSYVFSNEYFPGREVTYFSQDYLDIFAVCDTVKTWLRSLPQAIFPSQCYYEAIQIMREFQCLSVSPLLTLF